MIRAVTFDFWSTLFVENEGKIESMRNQEILRVFNSGYASVDQKMLDQASSAAWRHFRKRWMKKKITMTAANYIAFLCSTFKITLKDSDFELLVQFLEELSVKYPPQLSDGAEQAIIDILAKYPDMRFAVISDTGLTPGKGLKKIIDNAGVSKYFQHYTFSDEIKRSKPSKRAFFSTYEKLGVEPGETVHVGDLEETDIRGAKMWGAAAVLYRGGRNRNILRSRADCIIDNFSELPGFIEKLNRDFLHQS